MIKEANGGYVRTEFHHGITTVEFFHPQSNSLPSGILELLAQAIHGAGNEDETKVILLRSGGEKAFCAGASFDELLEIRNEEQGLQFFSGFAHVINAMRKCPKFIVARIQGKCVGGGVGLAAAADYALALEGADIKLSELAIGIGPFVVGPAVERKLGLSAFSQLAMDASQWRSAEWARKRGLFAEMYASVAELDEAVLRLSRFLAASNPQAMAELKKTFWEGTSHWEELLLQRAAMSGKLILSNFSRQALEKIRKK